METTDPHEITCAHGCCRYDPGCNLPNLQIPPGWQHHRGLNCPALFCPQTGEPLHADGTHGYAGGKLVGRCECGACEHCVCVLDERWEVDEEYVKGEPLHEDQKRMWVYEEEVYLLVRYAREVYGCPVCLTRLNSDGTADPGSVAWRDHEAMDYQRRHKLTVYYLPGLDEWCVDSDPYLLGSVGSSLATGHKDPAAAILAAKAALEVQG
jgi:hypothetical protein